MKDSVLIDTTYLLPLFGIEIEKFNLNDLQYLLELDAEILYNPNFTHRNKMGYLETNKEK